MTMWLGSRQENMHLLYSVIIAMITLVAVGYREWALESIQKEERREEGRMPGLEMKLFLTLFLS